jgi:hypothetical protein
MLYRQEALERVPIKSDSCCPGKDTADLVMDYLLHHGYGSTARALVKDYQYTTNEPLDHTDFGAKEEKQRQGNIDSDTLRWLLILVKFIRHQRYDNGRPC